MMLLKRTPEQRRYDMQVPASEANSLADIIKTPSGKNKIMILSRKIDIMAYKITKDKFNTDISGFTHILDSSSVKHALKKHSKDKIPLTASHLGLIKDILGRPDKIICSRKNRRGLNTLVYTKRFNNKRLVYVEEVRPGRHQLAMNTMYWAS
ncbi:hypothetical protein IKF34_00090 [Candidatus Saccharibacteria bacterium]|nr:hypothetical protein [Candidatus Saccharibacteria bacterium]